MSFDNVCMGYIRKKKKKEPKNKQIPPFQQLHTRKHVLTYDTRTANNSVLHTTSGSTQEKESFRVFRDSRTLSNITKISCYFHFSWSTPCDLRNSFIFFQGSVAGSRFFIEGFRPTQINSEWNDLPE